MRTLADRFWSKVDKTGDCWLWMGCIDSKGYGSIGIKTRTARVHRVSWELCRGTIPKGLFVLHTCDNRPCVNPDRLFLGTNTDNMKDMVLKGRARNGHIKLTYEQVREIRARVESGDKQATLVKEFGMSSAAISRVATGKAWKHVQ